MSKVKNLETQSLNVKCNVLIGVVIGLVIGNGNMTSLGIGLISGWVLSNPSENFSKIKEKLQVINNNEFDIWSIARYG